MLRAFQAGSLLLSSGLFLFPLTLDAHAIRGESPTPEIGQPVDQSKLVTLAGNTRPEANSSNDRGPLPDDFPIDHMQLLLKRSPEREEALRQLIDQLHDPRSTNFQKWLSPGEFGQRFGAEAADLERITGWLESHGFVVNVYPNRILIDFSGSAGQVRETFHTEIHQLEFDGVRHIGNMSDPQVPAELAPAVEGIVSLHDFMPHPLYKMKTNYTFPDLFGDEIYALVPQDLATIYNFNPLFKTGYSGSGQTIVLIENTNVYAVSDWSTFRKTFGLSSYTSGSFVTVHPAAKTGPDNCSNPGVVAPNDAEAILDAEWASAAAPNAAIEMATCKDSTTTFGGLIAMENIINESSTPPAIVSISYGECEADNGASANSAYSSAYQQAVTEGVSIFVAAGDEGAAVCDPNATAATHGIGVNAFASTAYNVAVGGTDFGDTYAGTNATYWNSGNTTTYGSAKSYIPEIPWNDSCGSVLLAEYLTGSGVTYGGDGFCNSDFGSLFLTTVAGSGGPSGCATGTPGASGVVSGTCKGNAKPSWQSGVIGIPKDGVRDLPDVSLFASDGLWSHYYIFCWSDTANGGSPCMGAPSNWSGAGGTSFASPIMAGIQALVNQKNGARQGNPNPVYYKLAEKEYGAIGSTSCNSTKGKSVASTCIFYDVTEGDVDVNCAGTHDCFTDSASIGVLSSSDTAYKLAYGTGIGWDFATGIGTVNVANLVNNWRTANSSGTTSK